MPPNEPGHTKPGGEFAPTRWTRVLRSRGESPEARAALSDLCEAYYEPVLRFLRREGYAEDTSRELAQEFFARVLQRGGLGAADPARGRFRSYLLGAVRHFLLDQHKHSSRGKRGGEVAHVAWEEAPEESVTGSAEDAQAWVTSPPDACFDREWALNVMDRSLAALERESRESGRSEQFDRLKPWLAGDTGAPSRDEAAHHLGMTQSALKVAIHRLRKRFREILHAEIAQTVAEGTTVQDELRYLIEVLSRG